jgi:hypothetical protein
MMSVDFGTSLPPKPIEIARVELVLAAVQVGAAQLQLDIAIAHEGIAAVHAGGSGRIDITPDQKFTPIRAAMDDVCESALEFARANGWTPPPAPESARPAPSELEAALDVLGRECEAFVMFARVGHLDPPRPDGKVPVAILLHRSADPDVDDAIRETARRWLAGDTKEG